MISFAKAYLSTMFCGQQIVRDHGVREQQGTGTIGLNRGSRRVRTAALCLLAAVLSGSLNAQLIGIQLGAGTDIAPQQNEDLRSSNYLTAGGSCSFWIHHNFIWHNALGVGLRNTRNTGVSDHLFLRSGLRGFNARKWYLQAGVTLRTPLSKEPELANDDAPESLSNVLFLAQASVGKYFRGYEVGLNAGIPVNTAIMGQTASFELTATRLFGAGNGKKFRTKRMRKKRYMPFGEVTWEDRARQHRR